MTTTLSPLTAALRRHDHDRYLTTLFAPAARRDALLALYAFNYEVARIRESVREPMLGLMRLQWWRDAIHEIYGGAPVRRHHVLEPLAAAIKTHRLPQSHFDALLDARASDMDETPPESLAALEKYAVGSSSSLVLLALEMLGVDAPAARDAGRSVGIAYALAGLLVAAPFLASLRRNHLPQDLIERHGVDLERSLFVRKSSPAMAAAAREIASRARDHLDAARAQRGIPRAAAAALLHGTLAESRLRTLAAADYDLTNPRLAIADPLLSLRLAWSALRGRF